MYCAAAEEWQAAMQAALNLHVERIFNPDRKDPHWGRKLARDRPNRSSAPGCQSKGLKNGTVQATHQCRSPSAALVSFGELRRIFNVFF
jgi:hypothetical protein